MKDLLSPKGLNMPVVPGLEKLEFGNQPPHMSHHASRKATATGVAQG